MNNLIIIIGLIILFVIVINNTSNFQDNVEFIISINVHEKPTFLLKQLDNIKQFVEGNYIVILNCNDFMYNELKNTKFDDNVIINQNVINKERNTGSLLKGIYSNIEYILKNKIKFSYFIILSSRNLFYCKMNLTELESVPKIYYPKNKPNYNEWGWPKIIHTKLGKYYINKNKYLSNSPHEGLVFNYEASTKLYTFLEKNIDIKEDLFNFNMGSEEFSLQSIIVNENSYYLYIGHGVADQDINVINCNEKKFVYKTIRI